MKNIEEKLIELMRGGFCSPHIANISRRLGQPASTIHYNLKKMEGEGKIRSYVAVFDNKKIGLGVCNYVLVTVSPEEFGPNTERLPKELSKSPFVQSVAIVTGDWELILKVRSKDTDEYYKFIQYLQSRKGVTKVKSLTILREFKTEFVEI